MVVASLASWGRLWVSARVSASMAASLASALPFIPITRA